MKITRVEATHINIKLPRDFSGSIYSVPEKNAIITRDRKSTRLNSSH